MIRLLTATFVAASCLACTPPEKSPSGFRLPDGDVERGRQAFEDLRCNACHRVPGVAELDPPVADPPVPVRIGGSVDYRPTDGRFMMSIVDPSHKIAPGFPAELIKVGDESRMPDYSDVMTVQQLVDLVAFMHSLYEYVPQTPVH